MSDFDGEAFNSQDVAPVDFQLLPDGWYQLALLSSEKKQTQKKDGEYFALEFQVIAGRFARRKVWQNMTWKNKSDEAVRIGRGQLSAMCRAVGVLKPQAMSELYRKPFDAKVARRKRKDTGETVNDVRAFEKIGSKTSEAAAQQQGQQQQGQQQQQTDEPPLWLQGQGDPGQGE